MKKISITVSLFLLLITTTEAQERYTISDKQATKETKALYNYLHKVARKHILFGHQSATEYGHGWFGDSGRSDVKSVTGSHPAVIGTDFSGVSGRPDSQVVKWQAAIKKTVTDTYKRGGITTVAWHFNNPVSGENFYWKDSSSVAAVPLIIPGGAAHETYKKILRTVAQTANSFRGPEGELIPVIFRPFHEFDGGWFWWGAPHCTRQEFISLWRFTVTYLRDTLGVHHFIYAFSPDCRFNNEATYLDRYPGDDVVDMVGLDDYADFGRDGKYDLENGLKRLKIVDAYAKRAGKLAAFTETGLESLPNKSWWMNTLLKTLTSSGLQLSYVLVWRNDAKSATHYYAPFPGHSSVPDFLNFFNHPFTFFEKDLKRVYWR